MNVAPPRSELDPGLLAETLATVWHLPEVDLAYRAVGFGSHHWLARGDHRDQGWFVTVDDLQRKAGGFDRLDRAMRTAWHLHHVAGVGEVVAPIATPDGRVLATVADGRWALALFPSLPLDAPEDGAWLTEDARLAAQRLVARIHAVTPLVPNDLLPREDFAIPRRDSWPHIRGTLESPWRSGPFSEMARRALRDRVETIDQGFGRYDALVRAVRDERPDWVISHGEPHAANILTRTDGAGLAIVDWDTVALAPKERDLWQLMAGTGDPMTDLEAYIEAAGDGTAVSGPAIALYRLRWDLSEIVEYAGWFSAPHEDTDDTRIGRDDLGRCLASLAGQLAGG